jgi:hypothetical protein
MHGRGHGLNYFMLGGYVYGLLDPRTWEIRYVGYTSDPFGRYYDHLYWRDHAKRGSKLNWHHINWLRKLKREGFDPQMIILATGWRDKMLNEVEPHLIAKYRAEGARLTNSTDGGAGAHGRDVPYVRSGEKYRYTPEGIAKLREIGRKNMAHLHANGLHLKGMANGHVAMRQPNGYYGSEKHRETGRNLYEKGIVTRMETRETDPERYEKIKCAIGEASLKRDAGGTINSYRDICSCLDESGLPRAFHPGAFGNHARKNPDHTKLARVRTAELNEWYETYSS